MYRDLGLGCRDLDLVLKIQHFELRASNPGFELWASDQGLLNIPLCILRRELP